MKTHTIFVAISLFVLAVGSNAATDTALRAKQQELLRLQSTLDAARDSLEQLTISRYTFRQDMVRKREADKEDFDRLGEQQDRVNADLSRAREEALGRDQSLLDEQNTLVEKQDEWKALLSTMTDLMSHESDALSGSFPIDMEERRASIERVRALLANGEAAVSVGAFSDYQTKKLFSSAHAAVQRQKILPDRGAALDLTLVRFGWLMAYGISKDNQYYIIRQTGRLGNGRFSIEQIAAPTLRNELASAMPQWIASGSVQGPVPFDIMQNDQTRMLVAGKKSNAVDSVAGAIRQGGWVMVPLLLLPFWALWITISKIALLHGRKRKINTQFAATMAFIDKGDFVGASNLVKGETGVMSRILEACLARKELGRHASERAVREIIMQEAPLLGRGINTLAVIAGAAPLLGLLGTISGMITLFAAVTHYGTGDPKFLAGGISEALITAKTGLAIAIPALFIHDFIRNTRDRLLAEIERLSIAAMNRIWPDD